MASIATSIGSPRKPARRSAALAVAAIVLVVASGVASADPKLLPAEQAFRFSARALDESTLEARFSVTDGYYLYRDKLAFFLDPAVAAIGAPALPPGKIKDDPFFGTVETYRGDIVVRLPLAASLAGRSVVLVADSQGCADVGVCYPAQRQKITLAVPAAGKGPGAVVDAIPPKKNWFN